MKLWGLTDWQRSRQKWLTQNIEQWVTEGTGEGPSWRWRGPDWVPKPEKKSDPGRGAGRSGWPRSESSGLQRGRERVLPGGGEARTESRSPRSRTWCGGLVRRGAGGGSTVGRQSREPGSVSSRRWAGGEAERAGGAERGATLLPPSRLCVCVSAPVRPSVLTRYPLWGVILTPMTLLRYGLSVQLAGWCVQAPRLGMPVAIWGFVHGCVFNLWSDFLEVRCRLCLTTVTTHERRSGVGGAVLGFGPGGGLPRTCVCTKMVVTQDFWFSPNPSVVLFVGRGPLSYTILDEETEIVWPLKFHYKL